MQKTAFSSFKKRYQKGAFFFGMGFARFLSFWTLFLIAAGASVTSTDSGLAVPDWPLSFGQVFPKMEGGVFYEHGHRMVATLAGIWVVLIFCWLWFWSLPGVRWAGLCLTLVVCQGLLGGITVLYLLPKPISISHALLAHIFLLSTVVLYEKLWASRPKAKKPPLGKKAKAALVWAWLGVVVLLSEILLGAIMRHFKAGLAIPDYPLVYGGFVPPAWSFSLLIHYLHRAWVVVLALVLVWAFFQVKKLGNKNLNLLGWGILAGLLFQALLGGIAVLTQLSLFFTVAHVMGAGVLIFLQTSLAMRLTPHRSAKGRAQGLNY